MEKRKRKSSNSYKIDMCHNYKQMGVALSQSIGQGVSPEAEEVRPNQGSLQHCLGAILNSETTNKKKKEKKSDTK